MKHRATLKDIANALNVSITTVSRALNDKEDISHDTKNAVIQVAQMLNYKPNALAVSLRKNTANKLIGVILPSTDHYFFSTILHGVMTASKASENLIIIGESNHDPAKEEEVIDMFADYYVSGIIIAPTHHPSSMDNLQKIISKETPVVLLDRTMKRFTGSYVQYDDYKGGYIATEHLISQGRRKIAHIRGNTGCSISTERYQGYMDALKDHGIAYDQGLVRPCITFDEEEGYRLTKEILHSADTSPNALFTVTDDVAAGAYEAIKELGLAIPEDIAIVGYSNSILSSHLSPKLTTVEQNGRAMGQTAFEILGEVIENPLKVVQKTYGAHLLIRNSSVQPLVKS